MERISFSNIGLSLLVNEFLGRVNDFASQNRYEEVLHECHIFGEYIYHNYHPRGYSNRSYVNDPLAAVIIACIVQQHAFKKLNNHDKYERMNPMIETNLNFLLSGDQKDELIDVWQIMQRN